MEHVISYLKNPVFDIGFMGQILLPAIIIMLAFPKREKFYIRLVIYCALALISALVIPYRTFESWHVYEPWKSLITTLGYLTHFLILVLCMSRIFQVRFVDSLFCCLMAYNVQHCVYCISKIFEISFPIYHTLWFVYMGVQWIPNGLTAFVIYRYLRKISDFNIKSIYVFIATGLGLIVNIALSSFVTISNQAESVYVYYFLIASIISCVALQLLQIFNISEGNITKKLEETRLLWKEDRHNYKIQKQNQEEFNMKVHDMKHFLRMFEGKVDPSVLNKMDEILHGREFASLYETNCLPLDVVLNLKNQECISKGIQFNFCGDGNKILFMDENDIYAVFGNIIDNAIDAVKLLDKELRIINLSFIYEMGTIIISCENYFSGTLSIGKNKELLTTKQHKKGHGYGVASIKYIAKKYHGDLKYHIDENQFYLTLLIKAPSK